MRKSKKKIEEWTPAEEPEEEETDESPSDENLEPDMSEPDAEAEPEAEPDKEVGVETLTEPIAAMPLQIFSFAIAPYEDWHRLAWAGALVLVSIMFGLSLAARYFGGSRHSGN